jgi:hypothetical protein
LSPDKDYVADAQQASLPVSDQLSQHDDIAISDKSIACCLCVASLSPAGDKWKAGAGFISEHKYLATNDYPCLARSLRQIACGTRFAERRSSTEKCHERESFFLMHKGDSDELGRSRR